MLGFSIRNHQDWLGENDREIGDLIDHKHKALCVWQNDINLVQKKSAHQQAKAEVLRRTQNMKNRWWLDKSHELQLLVETHDMRGFLNAIKSIYGPCILEPTTLRLMDGEELIKEMEAVNGCWKEHFEDLLSRDFTVDDNVFTFIPQHPTRDELRIPSTLEKVYRAIKQMNNN